MKNILYVIAMEKEAKGIVKKLELEKVEGAKLKIYEKGSTRLLITGIGKQRVAMNLAIYMENYEKPDIIINLGYAGSTNSEIGTWVNVSEIYNYEWEIPGEEKYTMDGIDNKELMKEWNQEKNILYNPADLTSGSSKKVWWKCKNGHEWEAVIHTRVKGVGCPYCMGKKAIQGVNDFATLYPEMLKEWDYEENDKLGIKPNELLVGSIKKVYWICSKGHKYDRSIYDRLHGRGNCPYCGNRKVLQGYNDLATTNPELLKDWDYEENDKLGIKPNEITNGGKEKVWWKCEKGHKWNSIIRSRITGSGCPYCSNNLVKKGYNDIATTNPELLEEWDYEKNDKLGIFPSNLSHGSTKLVWWKCKKGHEYQISVAQKTNRNVNCPICANQQLLKGYNDFATKHPELLKEWNYEKNDKLDIKPDEIILGGKVKFWWKCEKGHEWQSSIPARIRNDKLYNRCAYLKLPGDFWGENVYGVGKAEIKCAQSKAKTAGKCGMSFYSEKNERVSRGNPRKNGCHCGVIRGR